MDIKKEMLHGLFWSAVEKYSSLFVSIIVSMVLARILSPDEFGTVAIVTVIIQFLSIFCTMGLSPAIIQNDQLTDDDLNSIFSFSVLLGIMFSGLFFLTSDIIATFYENPLLSNLVRILSINLFFASANLVPSALMCKNLRFKFIAKRTFIIHVITGILSISFALYGAGVYSLLISPVLSSVFVFLYNFHYYPLKMNIHIRQDSLKKVFSYSVYQFGFEFINYFSRNMDKLIISRYMTPADLGYYEKSYRLMQMPMTNITSVINPVLQPILKNLQEDTVEFGKKFSKIIGIMAMISFPLGAILSVCSSDLIVLLYGSQWIPAAPCFSILALSLPLQIILSPTGAIFQAANSTKHQFYAGIRSSLVTVMSFILGILFFKTIESIAWAWTLSLFLNFFNVYIDLYCFVLKSSLKIVLKKLILPSLNFLLIFSVNVFFLNQIACPLLVSLIIKLFLSIILSLIYIQITGQYDIIGFIKKRNKHE